MIPSIDFTTTSGNSRNTLFSWGLVPDKKPMFALPEQKVQTIEIPGRNGVLDVSNSLTPGGQPLFNNREGSFTFYFLPPEYLKQIRVGTTPMFVGGWSDYITWKRDTLNNMVSFLHGQMLNIHIFDRPQSETYYGRVTMESYDPPSDGSLDSITINYSVEPLTVLGEYLSI